MIHGVLETVAFKIAAPIVTLLLAGAVSWGVMSARMDGVEGRLERIEERIDSIWTHLANGGT